MLSNTTSLEERNLAIQAGCVELIGKPLDQELVKELLSRLLNASSHSP
jgi:CheY-like chemotaxis protein